MPEICPGYLGVFCGNSGDGDTVHPPLQFFGAGNTHSAFGKAQVQYLIKVAPFLQQGILSHNSDIGSSVLHIDRYIGRLGQKKPYPVLFIGENQLS